LDTSNPGPLLMLGGGVLTALGSVLKWRGFGFGSDISGLSFDNMGLFGLLVLVIGLALAAIGGIRAFAPDTSLPESIAVFTLDQALFILAVTVFLWSFALISATAVKVGVHLTWIGAAIAAVGLALGMRSTSASSRA